MTNARGLLAAAILTTVLLAADHPPPPISADALRRHVEELASDRLQGRGNGTPGMDLAADYIAAEFKRVGLQPAGGDGFFQNAKWILRSPDFQGFTMKFRAP